MLPLVSSLLLCALLLWLFFGALQALAFRWLRPTLQTTDPAQASNLLLAWLALPPLAALLTCYVLYSPDLAQWLVTGHCHLDSCQQHGPQSTLAVFPALLLAAWVAFRVGRCARDQWLPALRLYRQLTLVGNNRAGFVSLDSAAPAAFTLGWITPKIFISQGMQDACSATDIRCIMLHETAHRRRRDNLRLLVARLLTAPLPTRWAQATMDDLKLSCEKACDIAASNVLSRESVAAALLHVVKLQRNGSPATSFAFVGNCTEQRIRALLAKPQTAMASELVFATASVTLLVVLAMINPIHRLLELLP